MLYLFLFEIPENPPLSITMNSYHPPPPHLPGLSNWIRHRQEMAANAKCKYANASAYFVQLELVYFRDISISLSQPGEQSSRHSQLFKKDLSNELRINQCKKVLLRAIRTDQATVAMVPKIFAL